MTKFTRTVYVDCTDTCYSGRNTGIQRVVRNIINRCPGTRIGDISFIPVFASYGSFYVYDHTNYAPIFVTKYLNRFLGWVRDTLDGIFDIIVNRDDPEEITDRNETNNEKSSTIHTYIVRSCRLVIPLVLHAAFIIDKAIFKLQPVKFNRGDVLFLSDVFWNTVLMKAVNATLNQGIYIILLVYDMIPVVYPQFVHKQTCDGFIEFLPDLFMQSDGVISISKSSLNDIKKYGTQLGYHPEFDYFHLGADFSSELSDFSNVRATFKSIFDNSTVYFMVGTIEPRKNHKYVLEAFKQLWDKKEDVKLCIVGKVGWKCKKTIDEIFACSQYNKHLFMINDASDSELSYGYTHSKAIIIASIAEGFGLPLIEAMHFGKIVFASDIAVFHEIGKDYPKYFSLDNPRCLADKIIEFQHTDRSNCSSDYVSPSWDKSIQDLFQKIVKMVELVDVKSSRQNKCVTRLPPNECLHE